MASSWARTNSARDRTSGAALAGRVGGAGARMLAPCGPPMRPRVSLPSRRELRVAGDEVGGGDVPADLRSEDRGEDFLDARGGARARHQPLHGLARALEQNL